MSTSANGVGARKFNTEYSVHGGRRGNAGVLYLCLTHVLVMFCTVACLDERRGISNKAEETTTFPTLQCAYDVVAFLTDVPSYIYLCVHFSKNNTSTVFWTNSGSNTTVALDTVTPVKATAGVIIKSGDQQRHPTQVKFVE